MEEVRGLLSPNLPYQRSSSPHLARGVKGAINLVLLSQLKMSMSDGLNLPLTLRLWPHTLFVNMKINNIPVAMKLLLADEVVPAWVQGILHLPDGVRFRDLGAVPDLESDGAHEALLFFLRKALQSGIRNKEQRQLKCFPNIHRFMELSDLEVMDLSNRTHNRVALFTTENVGLKYDDVTFDDLMKIESFGVNSLLEYLVEVENLSHHLMEKIDAEDISTKDFIESVNSGFWGSWSENVGLLDPRYSSVLDSIPYHVRVNYGLLDELVRETLLSIGDGELDGVAITLAGYKDEIKKVYDEEETGKLDEVLVRLIEQINTKRPALNNIFLLRFGWSGLPPATLEECGTELGVTRERIRQLEKGLKENIPEKIVIQKLDEANELLTKLDGFSADQAAQKLKSEGLTTIPIDPRGVLTAFSIFNRNNEPTFEVKNVDGKQLVLSQGSIRAEAVKNAKRLCSRNGLTTLKILQRKMALPDEELEHLKSILLNADDLVSLDADKTIWVQTPTQSTRNRLVNISQKIFSCVNEVTLVTLREGVKRVFSWRNSSTYPEDPLIVPTLEALSLFYEWHPDFVLEGEFVKCREYLDPTDHLGSTEQQLFRIISKSSKGFLSRNEILRAIVNEGLEDSTAQVMLTYSPIIANAAHDAWKLIGRPVDSASISLHLEQSRERPRDARIPYHGWIDNCIVLVARTPEFRSSFVIGCPSAYQRFLLGQEFEIRDAREDSLGVLKTSETNIYGFYKFFGQYAAEEGDLLVIRFDIATQTAHLSLESESKVIEMFDNDD
jgi:hypothetical protein